jgi:ribonuclease HI
MVGNFYDLPGSKREWVIWFKRRGPNSLDLFHRKSNRDQTSDKMALTDPKKLYRQICKPNVSTHISSLKKGSTFITTDEGIEQELTEYLQDIARDDTPKENTETHAESPFLVSLMDKMSLREVTENLRDINKSSGAGYDQIAPAILKAVSLQTWTETRKKSKQTLLRENMDIHFAQDLKTHGVASNLQSFPDSVDTEEVKVAPFRIIHLLQMIFNLCIASRDMPDTEKLNIVTGLPKSEGQVTSTQALRPISVGPILARLFNKILASRLGALLVQHNLIDNSQFAFLPEGGIHEPIDIVRACWEQAQTSSIDSGLKSCFTIFYDISKAYDTIRWDSITNALRRIGAGESFVTLVHNMHVGTRLAMRTNVKGNITPEVRMYKSIKQGCPLAPLLFVIVMDELHKQYKELGGGYKLGKTMITSLGYCDDTTIFASDIKMLRKMDECTRQFFLKHGLRVNVKKTEVVGTNKDGTPAKVLIKWPGENEPFTNISPGTPVKYLGIHLTMTGEWNHQIGVCNSKIMNIVSRLGSKQITLLQGCLLIKNVLIPKLENIFRHATIPHEQLLEWDKYITRSINGRAELACRLHSSSVMTIMRCLSLQETYTNIKALHLLGILNRRGMSHLARASTFDEQSKIFSDLLKTNGQSFDKSKLAIKKDYSPTLRLLIDLYNTTGTTINKNSQWVSPGREKLCCPIYPKTNKPSKSPQAGEDNKVPMPEAAPLRNEFVFEGDTFPIRDTYELWGGKLPQLESYVTICTDGSTFTGKRSGAAIALMEDDAESKDLWGIEGFRWRISREDNYEAELAAINKAIRSVAVTAHLRIYTDSDAAIKAIKKHGRCRSEHTLLNTAGRPYLMAIRRALYERDKHGAHTQILHVMSHTGVRNKQSIGNEQADKMAKWAALDPNDEEHDINMMQNELKYVLKQQTTRTDKKGTSKISYETIHRNVKEVLKRGSKSRLLNEWANTDRRPKRGQLVALSSKFTLDLIDHVWRKPDSTTIRFLLDILNQADEETYSGKDHWINTCGNCGNNTPATTYHRICGCPAIGDLWNEADNQIVACIGNPKHTNPIEKINLSTHDSMKEKGCKHRNLMTLVRNHNAAKNARSRNKPGEAEKRTRKSVGNEKEKGYLYIENDMFAPLKPTYSNGNISGLMSLKNFEQGDSITPVAGTIQEAKRSDLLADYASGGIHMYSIDCMDRMIKVNTELTSGFGLGSFCRKVTTQPNAVIKKLMGTNECAWICATTNIPKGDEITVNSCNTSPQHDSPEMDDAQDMHSGHLMGLHTALETLGDAPNAHWQDQQDIRDLCKLYLHVTDNLYMCALLAQVGEVWRAKSSQDASLGGTLATTVDFVRNRYTWISLSQEFAQDLDMVKQAIGESHLPARAVALTHVPITSNDTDNITLIASFEADTISVSDPATRQKTPNTTQLYLIMIENVTTVPIDWGGLKTSLHTHFPDIIWHKERSDYDYSGRPQHHHRYQIHHNPSLVWYREDYHPPTAKDGIIAPKTSKTANFHKLLGALGDLPKSIKWDLVSHGHDIDYLDNKNLTKISTIIRNTALESYRRAEAWRRKRKYRLTPD